MLIFSIGIFPALKFSFKLENDIYKHYRFWGVLSKVLACPCGNMDLLVWANVFFFFFKLFFLAEKIMRTLKQILKNIIILSLARCANIHSSHHLTFPRNRFEQLELMFWNFHTSHCPSSLKKHLLSPLSPFIHNDKLLLFLFAPFSIWVYEMLVFFGYFCFNSTRNGITIFFFQV